MPGWRGAAGICVDGRGRVLLVLQGGPDERRAWAIPGGGAREGETLQACCIRDVREETGYTVAVRRELGVKTSSPAEPGHRFELHIFEVEPVGGAAALQDPGGLIHAVGWFRPGQLRNLDFAFPEDRDVILRLLGAAP